MKEGITSLDLLFLIKELSERIVGSRIRNIKQVNEKFIFELYNEKKKLKEIYGDLYEDIYGGSEDTIIIKDKDYKLAINYILPNNTDPCIYIFPNAGCC